MLVTKAGPFESEYLGMRSRHWYFTPQDGHQLLKVILFVADWIEVAGCGGQEHMDASSGFAKNGPRTSSYNSELVRNANSWAPPKTY